MVIREMFYYFVTSHILNGQIVYSQIQRFSFCADYSKHFTWYSQPSGLVVSSDVRVKQVLLKYIALLATSKLTYD